MRRFVTLSLIAVMALCSQLASAQQYQFGGSMTDHDGMMPRDFYTLSQVNFGFGTARSMAMAGAFTSLGGDASSININPAGLGMYRRNDFTITPMMGFHNAKNSATPWGENSQSRFGLSNIAAVFNVFQDGTGPLTSLSFGVAYNRVADLNYRYGYTSHSGASASPYRSINDMFSRQLGLGGVFPSSGGNLNYDGGLAYYWGGILAYNNYLLDVEKDNLGEYWTSANRLGVNAEVGHTVNEQSKGSIGEIDLSTGMNFSNKFYAGMTIGIQMVNWKRQLYYGEDYIYNGQTPVYSDGTPLANPATWMDYNQAINVKGAGINFKLGFIYRPIEALRLGVALHTPTYYSLEREYQAYMASNLYPQGNTTLELEDLGNDSWAFCSPTRLMFGLSYALGAVAVLSVDYERDWYNGIRIKNLPTGFDLREDYYRHEFQNAYKGSNTLRIGAEVKPLPQLSLRAGYGISDSALKNDKSLYYNAPTTYKTTCISAGIGYAFGAFSIDIAYQFIENLQTEYMLFYAYDSTNRVWDTASPKYKTDLQRNYAILTLGYKF